MEEADYMKLRHTLCQARNELNNIRKSLHIARSQFKNDFTKIENMIKSFEGTSSEDVNNQIKDFHNCSNSLDSPQYSLKPIGFIKSIHRQKNATPRQGSISTLSRGQVTIEKTIFNNPSHSLEGLKEYSHLWLIYIFHQNKCEGTRAKISPPRLDGAKLGVFATRSPHRPNALGLTLAQLDKVQGDTLFVSGIDLLDETPVIDIKPYIPQYDSPQRLQDQLSLALDESSVISNSNLLNVDENADDELLQNKFSQNGYFTNIDEEIIQKDIEDNILLVESEDNYKEMAFAANSREVTTPHWLDSPPSSRLEVIFNPIAEQQIAKFSCDALNVSYRLEYLKSSMELRSAISSALSEDPRSSYRRQKCSDRLYFFMVDSAHITAFFYADQVEVLRVCPPDKENPYYKLM